MTTAQEGNRPAPTAEETEAVRAQLERILASKSFRSSRRSGPLLRFLVERALDPEAATPKERAIGASVFGRAADYDTGSDPIVRVSVGEVRKRLAQYYFDKDLREELLIELLPGSYQPRFTFPGAAGAVLDGKAGSHSARRRGGMIAAVAGLGLAVVAGLALILWKMHAGGGESQALETFWKPLLPEQGKVSVVIGNNSLPRYESFEASGALPFPDHPRADATLRAHMGELATVNLDDATALMRIAQFVGGRAGQMRLYSETAAELANLKEGPAILIGALDNSWTLRATANLRYRFRHDPESSTRYYIEDAERPGERSRGVDFSHSLAKATRDYVLVVRLRSRDTGQPMLVVSGLGAIGTIAAANFLTDTRRMAEARSRVNAASWASGNLEIILEIDSIGETPTEPRILAVAAF